MDRTVHVADACSAVDVLPSVVKLSEQQAAARTFRKKLIMSISHLLNKK